MTPRFSVIVPTWKNLAYLDLAYRGLVRNSAAAHQVIVFFNEFDRDCEQWLEGKQVIHAKSGRNLGVCEAVNQAARLADTEWLCYLNDDMYVLPEWDLAFAPYLEMADKVWLSGTAIEAGKSTPCYIGGHDYGATPETFQERRLLMECNRLRRPYNVISTWTPTVIARRHWEAIGGFDEGYFPGNGSDPDLAMKMYRYGCRHFIGVGTSLVYHFSRRTIARFDDVAGDNPKQRFQRKWGMSWNRFFERVLHRDQVITPQVLAGLARQ